MIRFLEQTALDHDIPVEAVIKSDLLRHGLFFSGEALARGVAFKAKSYFIFSFDRVPQKELEAHARHATPEEIALTGGPFGLKRTIVSVRLNPRSPYRVEAGSPFSLLYGEEKVADVHLPESPPYYQKTLANGKPVSDIAPTIQWGYLIYITAFRLCQYWGREAECRFCDINENYRQQKRERSYTAIKSVEEVLEALRIIADDDPEGRTEAYTVTGGSILSSLDGLGEADFYARYARAIEKEFPGKWIGKAVVQALPPDGVQKLKGSGFQIYHPNFEVWDKTLFQKLCPGKEAAIGRDEWIRRVLAAADIFGPSHVIPNFVAGVELAKPHGFATVEEALASTAEGLDFFMSRGILPRFTLWCVEPNTALSEANGEPPPLDYFVRLLRVYRDTHKKYHLPLPPGYGPAGPGRAVFSVSAFMDVL